MYTTALLALATTASATIQGFNYGSTFTDQSCKLQSDFEADFKTSQGLVGASGFTSARIYTMVQCGSANDPISAIPAAISTKTSLLLGVWASAGDASFKNELAALQKAISQYGDSFTKIVDGISVGSEDLYRNSPMGIAAGSDVGAEPATIISYIQQVRDALKGTSLSSVQVGHVDTWTAWANGSNVAVANACDWVGVDAYPYFQDTMTNDIGQGGSLFDSAIAQTQAGIGGKPIWVTETGWPVSGKTSGQALPSLDNAKNYWDTVGCGKLFGKVNTWWFTLQDAAKATPNPSFGLVGSTLSTTPLYDLSCKNVSSSSSSSASAGASSTATTLSSVASSSGAAKATASASGSTGGSPGVSGLVSSNSSQASATGSGVATPTGASGSGSSGSSSGSSGSSSGSSSNGSGSSGSSSGSSSSGSGSSGSSSGTGAGTGSSAGNGSTGSNSTVTTGTPSKPSAITSSSVRVESFGAAFAALMMTICML